MSHNPPRRPRLLALWLALVLFHCAAPDLRAGAAVNLRQDEERLRALAAEFYALYSRKDLEGLAALWSSSSPSAARWKAEAEKFFKRHESIEVVGLELKAVESGGDRARLRVAFSLRATPSTTRREAPGLRPSRRVVEFVREAGVWKVVREQTAEEELAGALAAEPDQARRAGLLEREPGLHNVELLRALVALGRETRATAVRQLAEEFAGRVAGQARTPEELSVVGDAYHWRGSYAKALEFYRKSLALYEAEGDRAGQAAALSKVGDASRGSDLAAESYRKSLRLYRELGDEREAAGVLFALAGHYGDAQGNYAEALKFYAESLALFEKLGDRESSVILLNRIAVSHEVQGNYDEALESYERYLKAARDAGRKTSVANALLNIGALRRARGEYDAALDYYRQSLSLVEGDARNLTIRLLNIAGVYKLQGDYARALEYQQRGLKLASELGDADLSGRILGAVGDVHLLQGDHARALEHFRKSLAAYESARSTKMIPLALRTLGAFHHSRGEYAQALEYHRRGLALHEASGNKRSLSMSLNSVGETLAAQGDYAAALEAYGRSLALRDEVGDKLGAAQALRGLGDLRLLRGEHAEALKDAERAAALAREMGRHDILRDALVTAGRARDALGHAEDARRAFEGALASVEYTRANVTGQEERASYFAGERGPYEVYIDFLMRQHRRRPSEGFDALALQTSERARARSLLEALAEARVDIREGVDQNLLRRERSLEQQLNARSERLARMLAEDGGAAGRAAALKGEIDSLAADYRDVREQIRRASPRYAALTQPAPLDLKQIRELVLDAETVLLHYALGEGRSYLWAVTDDALESFELPGRAQLEKDARRVYELLRDGRRWATEPHAAAREYRAAAESLGAALLPARLEGLLGAKKRVAVVSDGALDYVPFGALPSKASRGASTGEPAPLVSSHEVVRLPSASTVAVLRRESSSRARAPKAVAVLADPVFEVDDERVARPASSRRGVAAEKAALSLQSPPGLQSRGQESQTSLSPQGQKSEAKDAPDEGARRAASAAGLARDGGGQRLSRLPFTRREAEVIYAAAPAGAALKSLDFDASRATATGPELARYRYVHFATHGLVNAERPELSGLVLSLVDRDGRPVDGFLRLHEIYNLRLPAELVVLSACQTALGREIKGEGLVGLTRGFMYAGSPRVVASLWKVDDAATAELMKRFYARVLAPGARASRPSAALREAQVEMWKQPRWRSPFFWAAFELQGEWR